MCWLLHLFLFQTACFEQHGKENRRLLREAGTARQDGGHGYAVVRILSWFCIRMQNKRYIYIKYVWLSLIGVVYGIYFCYKWTRFARHGKENHRLQPEAGTERRWRRVRRCWIPATRASPAVWSNYYQANRRRNRPMTCSGEKRWKRRFTRDTAEPPGNIYASSLGLNLPPINFTIIQRTPWFGRTQGNKRQHLLWLI